MQIARTQTTQETIANNQVHHLKLLLNNKLEDTVNGNSKVTYNVRYYTYI